MCFFYLKHHGNGQVQEMLVVQELFQYSNWYSFHLESRLSYNNGLCVKIFDERFPQGGGQLVWRVMNTGRHREGCKTDRPYRLFYTTFVTTN